MRKIVVAAFVSLDGVMQAPGGPDEDPTGGFEFGGWTFHYHDAVTGEVLGETLSRPFDLLLGRTTYDIFAAHWPHVSAENPIAKQFNAVTKYVATHDPATLGWANSQALGANLVAALRALKQEDGPDLLVQGSTELIHVLLGHDLVDELRVLTFPLVLGRGKRLFGDGASPAAFRLSSSRASTTGVVMSAYERSGEIKTGSFALAEPTAEEIERRAKLARRR